MTTLLDFIKTFEHLIEIPNTSETAIKIGPTYLKDQEKIRIRKCIITLYPTIEVISTAVREKVDLIVTYYKSLGWTFDQLVDDHYPQIKILLDKRIYFYEIPKEWTSVKSGLIEILSEILNMKILDVFRIKNVSNQHILIGRICQFNSQNTSLPDLVLLLKEKLGFSYIHYSGDVNNPIQKIAIIIGHPLTLQILKKAKRKNINVIISDSFSFLIEKLAEELDISLIESTPYIVNLGLLKLSQALRLERPDVEIIFTNLKPGF
ncbi:MAG: Nif3-like dinuclear metal center hexameric protein [Candidatus Helarchaeota archaeon]